MVLVTGGTGFVGREILRQLYAAHYPFRILVRKKSEALALVQKYKCEVAVGDVLKPETLFPAMENIEAVIHLVGIINETPWMSFEQAHVEGTQNVINAMHKAGVKRYLHMSALGVRVQARSRYHQTKWEAERVVHQSGLAWTIFRPSLIYGAEDQSLNILAATIRSPLHFFPNIGGGWTRLQPIAVDEVARCFVHAIGNGETSGQTFSLCGPRSFLWREIFAIMAEMEGKSYFYDDLSLMVLLRIGVWHLTALLPLFAFWAAFFSFYFTGFFLILAWLVFAWISWNWRTVLFFMVPAQSLMGLAGMMERFVPNYLQFGEQLKMLIEDNEGNPAPMMTTFGFKPKEFVVGLRAARNQGVKDDLEEILPTQNQIAAQTP